MPREIQVLRKHFFKTFTIYSSAVLLAGLSISALVQGLLYQTNGLVAGGTLLYIAGICSVLVAYLVFTTGRRLLDAEM